MKRLPNVPRKEEEVELFCQIFIDCLETTTNKSLSNNVQTLKQLLSSYRELKNDQELAYKRYQRVTNNKDDVLNALTTFLRKSRRQLQKLDEESSGKIAPLVNFRDRTTMLPGIPRLLEGKILQRGKILLSWQRPKRKDGGVISHYEVLVSYENTKANSTEDFQIIATSEPSDTNAELSDLPVGEKLTFKVVSRNHLGISEESSNILEIIL